MLTIIERYILRRASVIFAAAMISTLAIAWTTQVLKRINLVTDTGQSAAAFLELATLILPSVIPEILPFAMAIGIAQT
ncbi:MAG: LptF/LptG family permease, partial [Notoacmeibacter sp.]|nr:LptF/LptG family permease [Notoacmeibacter sp.]